MTTAAPVSGAASTLELDTDRPEMSASDGAPVGIARFVRTDDESAAEVAVAVVDAWPRHGVGTVPLAALARRAGGGGSRLVLALDGVPR